MLGVQQQQDARQTIKQAVTDEGTIIMSYCARSDIEARFGVAEVQKWADLDNNDVAASVTARITAAIAFAENEINDRLRRGPHVIPFEEPPPSKIVSVCASLAGIWMYESRGVVDYNPETGAAMHRHHWTKRDAHRALREIRAGIIVLDLTDGPATAPEFVAHAEEDDS